MILAVPLARVLFIECGGIGYLLWGISVLTLALIIQYFISIRRANVVPDDTVHQIREMFDNKQYREAIDMTASEDSFVSHMINQALSEATHGYASMERAMEEAAEERTTKMLRNIEWLNLIGNIGPMLGLMGTVWGMIMAFFSIVEAGGMPKPDQLAGAIGTALVTTLLGLAVAIPALASYSVLRNKIDSLATEAMIISEELIGTFRPKK